MAVTERDMQAGIYEGPTEVVNIINLEICPNAENHGISTVSPFQDQIVGLDCL